MPGILPMKVIKVGTSSQSRIAQACDRCRSKKIRCDGIRPTCTQCANVGFECKTSDKLSRRAFPRGYTESLEERVRALEAEVRDLKDLLDEKDEKIDMLSRMHGNGRRQSEGISGTPPRDPARDASGSPRIKEDTFKVSASPLVLGVENSDSYQMGSSSGRSFIEMFKRKLQEVGKPCADFNPEAFLHIQGYYPVLPRPPKEGQLRAPPRLFSDRCVNVFFQEWSPLFPVIHKPTFLGIYEEFVSDPDKVKSHHKLSQLHLVFSIAAISGESPDLEQIAICEQQWRESLEAVLMDNTIVTLQCLILAIIFCTIRADYKRLQYYRGIAVGLSHRLGLHQCQKQFSFGALTVETRKKVFWTLYTMDCFTAVILGLPRLLKEVDIQTEYPSDVDDEYVTEKGFQPTLPGEYTRISSAIALFRAMRILASVLDKIYPTAAAHELSLQTMSTLSADLDEWSDKLPQHLKLAFKQDKPSTDVTGSRSPLLAFAYYYIRTLIFRPALGSSLGSKAASALIAVGESSKHMIQITQLLEERNMSFSLCLNKADTLMLCGMELLYLSVELKTGSKTVRDTERLVNSVVKTVESVRAPGSYDFRRVAGLLISVDEAREQRAALPTPPSHSPEAIMAAPTHRPSPQLLQPVMPPINSMFPVGRHTSATMSETDLLPQQEKSRRLSMPQSLTQPELSCADSRSSFDGNSKRHDITPLAKRDHRLSLSMTQAQMISRMSLNPRPGAQGLEFLPLGGSKAQRHRSPQPSTPVKSRPHRQAQEQYCPPMKTEQNHSGSATVSTTAEWEALLGSMDGGQVNVYDAIYGGPGLSSFATTETPVSTTSGGWSPDSWDLSGITIGGHHGGEFDASSAPVAQSALSISDESLSSAGEELEITGLDFGHHHMVSTTMAGRSDELMMEPLNGHFGL